MIKDDILQLDRDTYIDLTQYEYSFLLENNQKIEDVIDNYENGDYSLTPELEVIEKSWKGGDFLESVYKSHIIKYHRTGRFYEMRFRPSKKGSVEIIDEGIMVGKTKNAIIFIQEVKLNSINNYIKFE